LQGEEWQCERDVVEVIEWLKEDSGHEGGEEAGKEEERRKVEDSHRSSKLLFELL
jgi:hypothetical protein